MMSACHNSPVLTLVKAKSLCISVSGLELMACLFVISRSSVRDRALAFLSSQQLNNFNICGFGWSQFAIAALSTILDAIQKITIDIRGRVGMFTCHYNKTNRFRVVFSHKRGRCQSPAKNMQQGGVRHGGVAQCGI